MATDVPLGIKMPYKQGNLGYFDQTYSDMERAVTNLGFLLRTAKGERPMMPTYGSDLRTVLFDPNVVEYADQLFTDAVEEAVEMWMPEVVIHNVATTRDFDEYPNSATLNITFSLRNLADSSQTIKLEVET